MKQPISVSMKFNGETEIVLTPFEPKDKELLGHAIRGNRVRKIDIGEDGSVKFTMSAEPELVV